MTTSIRAFFPVLQAIGLAGSLLGFALALTFGNGYASIDGTACLVAAAMDVIGIFGRRSVAIYLAVLKLLTVGFLVVVLFMPGAPATVVPAIDPRIGANVLALSWLPTFIGAIGRRYQR